MNVTDRTLEDVFVDISRFGDVGLLIVVGILAFLLGGFVVWLYLSKVKYVSAEDRISLAEEKREDAEKLLNEANLKITGLENEIKSLKKKYKDFDDCQHVKAALKKDETDAFLMEFAKHD